MWLFFALASRGLWAGGNAVDQILARAHPRHKILSVLTLEFCVYAPFAVIAYFLSGHIGWSPALFGLVGGGIVCYVLALLPYYRELQDEQAYNIIPYLETTPVFLTLFAMALYGERLSVLQMSGAAVVIACGVIFSWDFRYSKFKKKVLVMMTLSSLMFALYQLALKSATAYGDVWAVTFYLSVGQFLVGAVLFLGLGKVRKSIIGTCKASGGRTVMLSAGVGAASFLAQASLIFAFTIAPTTGHVAALSGTQPFFSFFLAMVLGRLLPQHYEPMAMGRELKWKMFLLAGIFFGVYLLAKG